jgi:hypothetical protein
MKFPLPSFQMIGIVAAVAFVLGGAAAWRVTSWQAAAKQAAAVTAAAKATREAQQHVIDTLQDQITAANAASQGYQNELTFLRGARDSQPVPVVRMCQPARRPASDLPAAPAAASGSDEGAPGAGQLPPTIGRDIGPELYRQADDADDVAAQLRALQDWLHRLN